MGVFVDQQILRQFMSTILKVLTAFLFLRWKNNVQRLINLRTITITLCPVKAFIEIPLILDTRD
jgi:hypothetical protein